jgi:hypothetical protein
MRRDELTGTQFRKGQDIVAQTDVASAHLTIAVAFNGLTPSTAALALLL